MPDALEYVPPIEIVGALDEILLAGRALEESLRVQCSIETIEVVDGRIQGAVSRFVGPVEVGRLYVGGDSRRGIAGCGEWDETRRIAVRAGVEYPRRSKDMVVQIFLVARAGDLL